MSGRSTGWAVTLSRLSNFVAVLGRPVQSLGENPMKQLARNLPSGDRDPNLVKQPKENIGAAGHARRIRHQDDPRATRCDFLHR